MAKLLEISNLTTHFFTQDGVVKAVDGSTTIWKRVKSSESWERAGAERAFTPFPSCASSPLRRVGPSPERWSSRAKTSLKMDDAEMRNIRGNRIAMVFQEPMTSLNPVLTIGRQLTETLELHQKMNKQQAKSRAAELLQTVAYRTPRVDWWTTLTNSAVA